MDFEIDRTETPTQDAATILVVRPSRAPRPHAPHASNVEIFCVERNKQTRFMGGAVVFPGGKVDPADARPEWEARITPPRAPNATQTPFAKDEAHLRAIAVAAARETLEEAALLHVTGGALSDDELVSLRARMYDEPNALLDFLNERSLKLDLERLVPIARWVTPTAESRRFDARFFVAIQPEGQSGAHDERETMASFWASPADVLKRFSDGDVTLMPPTHRMLEVLATCRSIDDVLAVAAKSCLEPICPKLVEHVDERGKTLALVLPGDPDHDERTPRVAGHSRYVLRDKQWLPENPPR